VGLAGVIGAIYPIASAGGYQLLGRTLSTWQAYAEDPRNHSILRNFDQIEFYVVSEGEFVATERQFKAGSWKPETRRAQFKMTEYVAMLKSKEPATEQFRARQLECSQRVAAKEEEMFAAFLKKKAEDEASGKPVSSGADFTGTLVASPLSASVWKVMVAPGDVIESDEQHVVELEAMKTSVFVAAGEGMKGKKVSGIAVQHGDAVIPGSALLYIE
jgi:biotin carboxyl carrier protein